VWDDRHKLDRSVAFAVEYLLACRSDKNSAVSNEVDTGLIKLLAQKGDTKELAAFLSNSSNINCEVEECAQELRQQQMFVALEKLYT